MPVIGIDLGTSNTCVAVVHNGQPQVILDEKGRATLPSVMSLNRKDQFYVGYMAKAQMAVQPERTIHSAKRLLGQRFDSQSVQHLLPSLTYAAVPTEDGMTGLIVGDHCFSPTEVSAAILKKVKVLAEAALGEPVEQAVISVPAHFDNIQRKETKRAAEIAGLEVTRLINEPTAAALAYGFGAKVGHTIAVYDFGGGTFDISILEIAEGVIEVLSTNGDAHLGGDDIDQAIVDYLAQQFERENNMDIRGDALILQRLREAAEKAKMELSSMVQTEIYLPFLTADQSGPKHLRAQLSRAQLDAMMMPLVERSLECCKRAFEDAGLKQSDIAEVLLVGGSTRIPLVQREVERYFGKTPNHSLNPDEVVAIGAAIQGGVLAGDVHDIVLLDVTPLTLGVEANGGLMVSLIDRNTTIPTKKTKLFSTTVDNQSSVTINVYQGERQFAAENRFLGQFELADIEPAPRAVPQIEVCFDIDANGVLRVSATNKKTNKAESLVLMGAGGLTDDEIRSAIADAEAARQEDEKRKELLVAKNKAQSFIFSIARMTRENENDASDELKAQSKAILERADATLADEQLSLDDLEQLNNDLSSCSCKWYEIVYAKEAKAREEQEQADRDAQQQAQNQASQNDDAQTQNQE